MLRLHTLGGLWIDGNVASAGRDVRPRRLALLAIIAAAGARGAGISREQVLGILWAKSEPERARHSLSQALYALRRELGGEIILAGATLRLDPAKMTSDVGDLRVALAEKNWESAADLFGGPFLAGFYLGDAAAFERWADEERSGLTHAALRAIEAAAQQAAAAGRTAAASERWRQLTTHDPLNSSYAAALIQHLVATGHRAGAMAYARSHVELVRRELEMEPDPEIARAIDALRAAEPSGPVIAPPQRVAPVTPVAPLAPTRRDRSALWRISMGSLVAIAAATAFAWNAGARRVQARTADPAPVAIGLYDDGLRAFYQFDAARAARLFDAALGEDSSFVMAAYFAWRSEVAVNGPRQDSLASRALRLASSAPERDRLLIQAHLRAARWDLGARAAAESLVAKFPNDVEALIRAASITADLPHAAALLDRAIALDSAVGARPNAICHLCDAFATLVRRFNWADSSAGVVAALDRWSALRPADYQPWQVRSDYLIGLGRLSAAASARRHAESLGAPRGESDEARLVRNLRSDDVAAADAICRDRLADPDDNVFARFRWLCTIDLRMEGRYREALGLVHDGRVPWTNAVRSGVPVDRVHAAILDMEMGRPSAAAVQFARLAAEAARSTSPEGIRARMVTWELTLSATALALAGDTTRVRALADSVEFIGHRSLYARDPLLHHFLRGVVLAVAGEHERAVREYRAAVSSPSEGYTRINYELGKSLLATHRANEAIPIVRSALRGGIEGSGLYVTRSELHELLAQAFDAAGQQDSAAVHYTVVERAWRNADPSLLTRYEAARRWLAQRSSGSVHPAHSVEGPG